MLAAVIDIGSNSVRLVLYQCEGNHVQPVFNQKSLCSLGATDTEGYLPKEGKDCARMTIARFRHILDARQPNMVQVLATAAIRNARDGTEFAQELSDILERPVEILSGMDEARYAAAGVQATSYNPRGLVVDMGGGSVELARLGIEADITPECSIPSGSLVMAEYYHVHGREAYEAWLEEQLEQHHIPAPAAHIYAVGGSFRAIARHHMKRHAYPLRIIHDYGMNRQELLQLIETMEQDVQEGYYFTGVAQKRQKAALPAAILLNMLMYRTNAADVIFASAGIREGALRLHYHDPDPYDPLLALVQALPSPGPEKGYMEALAHWIHSVLPCTTGEKRLVRAFCEISEIATAVHPDYRAEYAFERILSTLGYGMQHDEQVMLALALYHRHRAKLKLMHPALTLISERQQQFAYALGQLADMAYSLSAGSADLLEDHQLDRDEEGSITLKVYGGMEDTRIPHCEKWCEGLGEAICALINLPK